MVVGGANLLKTGGNRETRFAEGDLLRLRRRVGGEAVDPEILGPMGLDRFHVRIAQTRALVPPTPELPTLLGHRLLPACVAIRLTVSCRRFNPTLPG